MASIQKRTSPVKFAHLAEKSGKDSISNLSTKVRIDMRNCSAEPCSADASVGPTVSECTWIRCGEKLPADPHIHTAILAYISDYGLLEVATLPWGGWMKVFPRIKTAASLDHSIWFHA